MNASNMVSTLPCVMIPECSLTDQYIYMMK